jgi:hypothetical protein
MMSSFGYSVGKKGRKIGRELEDESLRRVQMVLTRDAGVRRCWIVTEMERGCAAG